MQGYVQILIFVTIGVALLWFGYSLLIGQLAGIRMARKAHHRRPQEREGKGSASPGDPQACPICSSKLEKGDMVNTLAFPSITGGRDRLMHIRGCMFCIAGNLERNCPVCDSTLADDEILVARMFERSFRHNHVHVLGCNHCRRLGIM
jgi:hypothetical protein